jgi:competence protein ComGC
MTINQHRRGATLLEVAIVVSLITTLVVITVPTTQTVRQVAKEEECRQQLAAIGQAIVLYRLDHRGQDPPHLELLVPEYLSSDAIVCPMVRAMASRTIATIRSKRPQVSGNWCSYTYFRRQSMDRLYARGDLPTGYSRVLQQRGGETPVVACHDHRQPFSLEREGAATPEIMKTWYFPERPELVLRYSGRVDRSHYGGLIADGVYMDGPSYLLNL